MNEEKQQSRNDLAITWALMCAQKNKYTKEQIEEARTKFYNAMKPPVDPQELITSKKKFIETLIKLACHKMIQNPDNWQQNMLANAGINMQIGNVNNNLSINHFRQIEKMIQKNLPQLYCDFLLQQQYKLSDQNISDTLFLSLLGKKRNWKKDCAICLEQDIMGTKCNCGHTEITVFRPCGHSICSNPCFVQLITNKFPDIALELKIHNMSGMEFHTNKLNLDLDIQFSCPLCRCNVTRVFSAENVAADVGDFPIDIHAETFFNQIQEPT